MDTLGINPSINQAAESPRRKSWHGILFGLGCALLTLAISFLCLSAIVIGSAVAYFAANEAYPAGLSNDEILQGWKWIIFLVAGASLLLALVTGTLFGRAVYRQSAEPRATRRLFSSILAGLGFGILFLVIGILAGVLIDSAIISSLDLSFGDSVFSLAILIPTLTGIFAGLIGIFLGTLLIFRILRPKNKISAG